MAARFGRRRILLPLLALLFLRASAAVTSPESAVAAARTAIDRAEFPRASAMIEEALRRYGSRDVEAVWTLRVMWVEAQLGMGKRDAVNTLLQPPPPKYRTTEASVWRLIYLGYPGGDACRLDAAEAIAKRHWPRLLGEVYRGKAALKWKEGEADARMAIHYAQQYKERETEAKANAILAFILGQKMRWVEGIEAGERARSLTRLPNVAQNAEGNLGWMYYELGDYAFAEELLTSAAAVAQRSANAMNAGVWLTQLGNIRYRNRDYAEADRYNAQAVVATQPLDRGYALANRARIALAQRQFEKARAFNRQAIKAKQEATQRDEREEALLGSDIIDARILTEGDGEYAAAEKLLLDVVAKTKEQQLDALTQLARLYVRWKRHDRAEATFRQAMALAGEERRRIDINELQLPFFNTVDEMLDAYVDFLVDMNRPGDALMVVEASRAQTLEEGRGETPRHVDARAIARQHGATILSYWLGRKRSYVWVITAAEVRLVKLPADLLVEREVEAYQRELLRLAPPPLARGRRLYQMLVGQAKIPGNTWVIVIPDGLLHTLNFDTLVVPGTERYWIEDVTAVSAPSLQLLARPRRPRSASPSMLLVGDTPSPDPVSYPPLKYAPGEMSAVARHFPKRTVLEGAKATPAAYRASRPETHDYVHFVAHGVALPTRPLDSFIVLAPGGGSYKLLAREIEKVALNARLVTISSCEGAGKRTYAGEGVVGLAWAFLHAGADEVIASLWPVSDNTTARLMDDMYAGISAGKDPAVALRDAKLALMRRSPLTARPRHWAPFVLYAGN